MEEIIDCIIGKGRKIIYTVLESHDLNSENLIVNNSTYYWTLNTFKLSSTDS